jgi:hypothetical protein
MEQPMDATRDGKVELQRRDPPKTGGPDVVATTIANSAATGTAAQVKVDRNIEPILDELDALGLASNTIVVLTADHGDLDGAHGLHAKGATSPGAVRDGVLFCYNMFAYIDGDFMHKALEVMAQPDGKAKLKVAAKEGRLRPDLSKRGAIRSVFDGRYQFTRYFSPLQHNRPTSLEVLVRLNDVELFDHEKDPLEIRNLAGREGQR